ASGLGFEICAPDSARQAYDALVAAAPDGSEVETGARGIADDARTRGVFDSDETISRLDELARSVDYSWDCQAHAYRHEVLEDDPSSDDEAVVTDPVDTAGGDAGPAQGSSTDSTAPDAQAQEKYAAAEPAPVPGTRPPEPSSGSPSPTNEVRAVSDGGSEIERLGRGGAPLAAAPTQGSPLAPLAVSTSSSRSDGGVLRWMAGGGLLAAVAVVVHQRRR
ncbi:MAG TPA: hypothetical protein VGR20_07010, partial [Acidimicrobiia bacterium]|nr:hypothetical protein [Acidimicrobiia bacterium]